MKQLLLICAVVGLVGCWKKEAPKEENRVRVQRVTPNPELPKATVGKLIADPIVEKAIRKKLKKPTGELTKADYEKVETLNLFYYQLTELPKGLEKLTQLERLWLGHNQLNDVKGLEKLTQLTELSLTANQLTEIPEELEKLTLLKELWLVDNQLTDVTVWRSSRS
jgi:internalin A